MKLAAIILLIPVATCVPFRQCLADIRKGKWGLEGGFDSHGNPASDISMANAISYDLCKRACGTAPQPLKWPDFTPQFSAWLLPSLALVSLLPFGANNLLANLMSMFLAIGSPTLAAYSLALTVLNGRWIARRFESYGYPDAHSAVRFLNSLQQSPLRVTTGPLLADHVVPLPGHHRDRWWSMLAASWLSHTHTWSISAATSILWVLVAYVLTVVGSFKNELNTTIDSHGQAIGSLWLWLLPIITCWLQISPKHNPVRLQEEVERTGTVAYAVAPSGDPMKIVHGECAISFSFPKGRCSNIDAWCTAPIYNYARFLPWVKDIEFVCNSHRAAQGRRHCNVPWRFLVASLLALFLQWGTTGAAIVINWFTPTIGKTNVALLPLLIFSRCGPYFSGLGCHSGASLLYGGMGTLIWIILILSSFLSHYSTSQNEIASARVVRLSVILRWFGKFFAILNSIWVVAFCLLQLGNFFDRCWCDGGVIQRGADAYIVIEYIQDDITSMKRGWTAGVSLAVGSTSLYVAIILLFMYFP